MEDNSVNTNTRKVRSIAPLNVLRVLATLMVFMLHANNYEGDIFNSFYAKGGLRFILYTPAGAAVWIFFILSGYLAGKGYITGRYEMTLKGTLLYLGNKIKKIYIPAWCFLALSIIVCSPQLIIDNLDLIVKFLTFTYDGTSGTTWEGPTWYIFTLFWLYLITPIVALLLNKLKNKPKLLWALLFFLWVGGAAYRIMATKNNLDWQKYIYTPFYANLDLYFGGMIVAYLSHTHIHTQRFKATKPLSAIFLAILIICNCYIYIKATLRNSSVLYNFYLVCFQSVYLPVILLYLSAFDAGKSIKEKKPSILRDIFSRLIDWLSSVSFEFYLFHSLILDRLSPYILKGEVTTVGQHLLFLSIIAIVTLCFAAPFHNAFGRKKINPVRNVKTETAVPEK